MVKSSWCQTLDEVTKIIPLSEVKPDDKYCIFWDAKGSLGSQYADRNFSLIQRLLATVKCLLWVTARASSECPDTNLALGLMRVVRSETGGRFATLDLESGQPSLDHDSWDIISRVFKRVIGYPSSLSGQEMEFAEKNGRIEIPRLISEEEKNAFIVQETCNHVIKPQPFTQEARSLKLKLGRPGILDDIYFEDDESLNNDIGDDEVEIAVEAAGMNFKGSHNRRRCSHGHHVLTRNVYRCNDRLRSDSVSRNWPGVQWCRHSSWKLHNWT